MCEANCSFNDRFVHCNVVPRDVICLEELKIFDHQVAGHGHGIGKEKRKGMCKIDADTILKPVQEYPRGKREIGFYEHVFMETDIEKDSSLIKEFIPQYHGIVSVGKQCEMESDLFLKMEDLTKGFRFPCIMDVKIGKISYDPLATEAKIKKAWKSALSEKVGFRILGFKVFNASSHKYEYYDNAYGKSLATEEELQKAFLIFLSAVGERRKKATLSAIISRLQSIQRWFERQRTYMIRASSVVVIYEGGLHEENGAASEAELNVKVKMIDFAHVFEMKECDNNYLEGLEALISTLSICSSITM